MIDNMLVEDPEKTSTTTDSVKLTVEIEAKALVHMLKTALLAADKKNSVTPLFAGLMFTAMPGSSPSYVTGTDKYMALRAFDPTTKHQGPAWGADTANAMFSQYLTRANVDQLLLMLKSLPYSNIQVPIDHYPELATTTFSGSSCGSFDVTITDPEPHGRWPQLDHLLDFPIDWKADAKRPPVLAIGPDILPKIAKLRDYSSPKTEGIRFWLPKRQGPVGLSVGANILGAVMPLRVSSNGF